MRTAADTNIFVGLFSGDPDSAPEARAALSEAQSKGSVAICPAVYAELVAGRTPETVDTFFSDKGIEVDWNIGKEVWREAGIRYARYARTRARQPDVSEPRRILADFLIGSHALEMADALLTAGAGVFSTYFPELEIVSPTE